MENENYYWQFLEDFMNDYYHSKYISDITHIEAELDERMDSMPEQEFNDSREELRRLTLKCFDEALCNFINAKYPGAVDVKPKY